MPLAVATLLLATLSAAAPRPGLAGDQLRPVQLRPVTATWQPEETRRLPIGKWHVSGALRFRYISLKNVYALGFEPNPKTEILRLRTQVAFDRRFSQTLNLYGRLNNESSSYSNCKSCEGGFDEIIFENLYLEALEPWGLPVGVRLGRQDLFYGDGFLIADGTPLDESRTTYVNAALLTATIPLWAIDLFLANDPAKDVDLPLIHSKHRPLTENHSFLGGVFMRREPAPGTKLRYSLEPYYAFMREKNRLERFHTHTIGTRLGFAVGKAEAVAEVAYQGGKVPAIVMLDPDVEPVLAGAQSISALGYHTKLVVHLAPPVPLDLEGGYVYLTGDQRKTRNKYEGWNPLLGRWPIWSELYIYTLAVETIERPTNQGLAFWQNLAMPYFRVAYDRHGPINLEAKYLLLNALESFSTDILIDPSYVGPKHRGDLIEFKVGWQLPGAFAGHLLYEKFRPGKFYPSILGVAPKEASYLRLEVSTTF